MSKVMYITMGTSLFNSASWELGTLPIEPRHRSDFRYYEKWLSDVPERYDRQGRCPRNSPDARLTSPYADRNRAALAKHLKRENGPQWAKALPQALRDGTPIPGDVMRFSAEMSTLLKLYEYSEEEADSPRYDSFGEFLRSYSRIEVLLDDRLPAAGLEPLGNAAGQHLIAYINEITGRETARGCEIGWLSSTEPDKLIRGLGELARTIEKDVKADVPHLDLVISGGYKIYGVVMAHLTTSGKPGARIIYIHETGSKLISFQEHQIAIEGHKPVLEPVGAIDRGGVGT